MNRPIRIAYVVHTFGVGGMERYVARMVNALDRTRFAPCIVCLNRNGTAAGWIERDDVAMIELGKRPGNDPRVVARMARALRTNQVDLVHSHNWGTLLETGLARRWAGVPAHVHAERGMELDALRASLWKRRIRSRLTRWALDRTDAVITNAEAVRENLYTRCGRLRHSVQVIPNGVDIPAVAAHAQSPRQLRDSLSIPPDARVLGSVGRLVPVKGFETAIEAATTLIEAGHKLHLVVVGEGPEERSLIERSRRAGIESFVHFVGLREDVANWLAIMDLYLNVSLNEGMSQSIVEAMGFGLPMVVTDVGDNAVLVDGDQACGLVVPPGDATAVASAVARLLEAPLLRDEFRRNAQIRHQAKYCTERMVQAYEDLYLRLLAPCQPQRRISRDDSSMIDNAILGRPSCR